MTTGKYLRTEYHLRRLRERKIAPMTSEWRRNISLGLKGKRLGVKSTMTSEQQRLKGEKISKAKRGIPHPNQRGEKNSQWKGGVSSDINKYVVTRNKRIKEELAGRPQPEQCEICGGFGKDFKKGLCFDHDHETGKFRGWICLRCNTAIGLVKENTETLIAIIKYISLLRLYQPIWTSAF